MRTISCDAGTGFVPLGGVEGERESFRPLTEPVPPPPVPERPAVDDPFARAFQAGLAQGRAEAHETIEGHAREIGQALAALAAVRERMRTGYAHEVLALAVEMARKILGEELAVRPERWLDVVRAGVRDLVDRERVVVHAAPGLAAHLREAAGAFWAACGDAKEVVLVDDPALPEGGCLIETASGDVDVGIESQLDAIADALGLDPR